MINLVPAPKMNFPPAPPAFRAQ
uniref:Uncharacterized protein n=1 Tax=Anguilla anguilla TaxID=7936 RepID=A0A0E9SIA3_ANGAN